jgi:hypothetical protein
MVRRYARPVNPANVTDKPPSPEPETRTASPEGRRQRPRRDPGGSPLLRGLRPSPVRRPVGAWGFFVLPHPGLTPRATPSPLSGLEAGDVYKRGWRPGLHAVATSWLVLRALPKRIGGPPNAIGVSEMSIGASPMPIGVSLCGSDSRSDGRPEGADEDFRDGNLLRQGSDGRGRHGDASRGSPMARRGPARSSGIGAMKRSAGRASSSSRAWRARRWRPKRSRKSRLCSPLP